MKPIAIYVNLCLIFGITIFQNLEASFDIYGKGMAKDGLTNTLPTSDTFIESASGSVSIDLNSSSYRYRRALNIRNVPSNSVNSVAFYVDGVKVSEDFSDPYMLFDNGNWLPSEGTYTVTAKHLNSNGTQINQETLSINIIEPLSHRKRKVFLSTGIPNQAVQIKMKNHEYIFGSQTVESWTLNDTNPDDPTAEQRKPYPIRISGTNSNGSPLNPSSQEMQLTEKYREVFLENFNYTVAGNAMKWYSNGESGTDFTSADRWHQWHRDNNIPVRGHTLLWGRGHENENSGQNASREMHDRESVENLMEAGQFEAAKTRIKTRIQGIVSHYAGEIDEWDFNNELWNFDKYRKEFDGQNYFKNNGHGPSGDSILAEFEQWAREANPNIKLFHNDFNIITQSNTSNATKYRDLIQDLRDNHGVDVDGIGVQGHFGWVRSKQHIMDCFDILSTLGLPIKVTEFDAGNDSMSDSQRAQLLENLYRASFEHQNVEGVIMWGFWSGCHWRRAKAPWQYVGYERNDYDLGNDNPLQWTETPQVDRYQDLVFGEWWTDTNLVTDENGNIEISAFAGDYDILINGVTYNQSISTNSDGETLYLQNSGGELTESLGDFEISNPSAGSIFPVNAPIEINTSYPDGSDAGISSVEFYINGILRKADSVSPFRMTWYDTELGNHEISIIAQGNSVIEDSIFVSVSATSGQGPNLISNSGFDTAAIDSNLSEVGADDITISTTQAYSGSSSLFVDRPISGTGNNTWRGVKYNFDLEEGSTYNFSAKIFLEDDSNRIALTTKKENTNIYTYPSEITNAQGGIWYDLSGEFLYQSAQMDFLYIAGVDAGVDFYVDDISLSKVGGFPLINPDDTDGDGMLDTWEQQFFPSMNVADVLPNADADGDGATNLEEFRSDTIPLNPFLSFHISDYNYGATSFECEWRGSPNKDYRVLSTTDLSSGEWSVVEEALSGSLTYNNTWSNDHQGAETKFYKVEIDD